MSTCAYPSIIAQAYEGTHWIPWLVPFAVACASFGRDRSGKWGKQILLIWYGFFLTLMQVVVYIFQNNFNTTRNDPYCVEIVSYAFPSMEAYYVGALSAFIFGFTYFWNLQLAWSYWTMLILFVIGPSGIFIWFQYNTVSEILMSAGIGSGTTILFLVFVRFIWLDYIPFLLQQAPWTWFNCIDSYVTSDDQQQETIRIAVVLKELQKEENDLI
jgi:hypothetical protein